MEHLTCDNRIPLEAQLKLRVVEMQSEQLDAEQLRECLLAAWSGWLLERHLINRVLDSCEISVDLKVKGYTPAELFDLNMDPRS